MSDILQILLQAKLDKNSANQINKDIEALQKNVKEVKVKVDVTNKNGLKVDQFKDMNDQLSKLGKFDLAKTPLVKGMEIVGYSVKDTTNGLTKFSQSLNDGKNNIVTYSGAVDKTSGNYEILGKSIRQASRDNNTFIKELGIAIQRTITWSIAVGGFYKAIREIKDGVTFIKDVDKDLTSIQMVTGKTAEETRGLADEYANLGKQLGITTNEILKGSLEWYRQGKTASETNQLITASIMEAKLAGIDTATATEYLTSTLNGFKLEASDAIDVVSKMVAIDNIAATSVAELSEALKRSANSADQAGVSIDTLLGYIGTVSSVSRKSASSVGESFKTMFARFQDVKQGNLDEDGIGLSDVENSLNRVGVALRSSETDFRDLDDVIADISERWSGFDEVTQSSIAKSVAGVRQRENFLILMTNYQEALKLETESLNSAGLAQERYAIYLESTEAKMAKLTATGEKFWLNLLDSNTINTGIELITALISGLDQLTNHNGILGVSLVALSIAFALVYHNLKLSKISLAEYIALSYADITATNLLALAKAKLAGALTLVKNGFMFLFATPLGWITLAIGGVLALTNHLRKQREEVEKLTTTYNDYQTALATMNIDGQRQSLNEITEMQKELNKLFEEANKPVSNSPNGEAISQARKNQLADYIEQIKSLGYEVDITSGKIKDLDTIQNNLKIEDKIKAVTTLTDRQIRQNENLTSLIDTYLTLSQVEKKNEKQKAAMTGIVKELKNEYDDLVISLDKEGNMQITNIGILKDKKNALQDEKTELVDNVRTKITALVDEQTVTFNNTKMTIGAIRDRIDAYNEEIKVINQRNKTINGSISDSKTLELEDAAYKKNRRQNISGAIDLVETVADAKIEELMAKYGKGGGAYIPEKTNTSGDKKPKEIYKAEADRYNKINQEIAKNNSLIERNKTLQDLAGDDIQKKITLMEEQIELEKDHQKLLSTKADMYRKEAIELEKILSGQGFNFAGSGDNRMITNLDAIQGKTKEVEESFNRYIDLQKTEIPKASQEWMSLSNTIKTVSTSIQTLTRDMAKSVVEMEKQTAYADLEVRQRESQAKLDKAKAKMERDVEDLQSDIDGLQSEIDKIQEQEKARTERLERNKRLAEINQLEARYYFLQNKNLSDLTEEQAKMLGLEDEREKYLERQIKLQELQIQLTNTQNEKNIQQLTKKDDGTWDFTYVADQDKIDDINKQIEDTQKEHSNSIKNLKETTLDSLQTAQESYDEWERLNDIQRTIEAKQRRIQRYQDEMKDLQDAFAEKERRTNEAYAVEKANLDLFYTDMDSLTELKLQELHATFGENWTAIYGTLTGFFTQIASEYDKLASKLSTPLPTPSYSSGGQGFYTAPSKGGGGGGGSIKNAKDNATATIPGFGTVGVEISNGKTQTSGLPTGTVVHTNGGDYEIIGTNSDGSYKSKKANKASFADGGKVSSTGTVLTDFHGTQNKPEWIFNDSQLQNVLKSAVLSTIKVAIPTLPQVAMSGNSGGDTVFHIAKLEFPNITTSDGLKEAILDLPRVTRQKIRTP